MDAESGEIKEVYARFGLALYCAQVLEHGLLEPSLFSPRRYDSAAYADKEMLIA